MEKNCCNCVYFGELKTPWERKDGTLIYGYCFRNSLDEKGYAVFIPDGICKHMSYKSHMRQNYIKRRSSDERIQNQNY